MKKKKALLVMLFLFIGLFCGCDSKDELNNPFSEKFINGITEFRYHCFDGDIKYYSESSDVEQLKEVLVTGKYVEIDEDFDGYYEFEIISNNESHFLYVLTDGIIVYNNQMYAVNGSIYPNLDKYTR